MRKLKAGDTVMCREHGNHRKSYGKVKTVSSDGIHAFAVFRCNNDWDNYRNYTAQRFVITDAIIIGDPDRDLLPVPEVGEIYA